MVGLISNIAVLALVYLLYRRSNQVSGNVDANLRHLEDNLKQVEYLQNQFKNSLENIISKDSLMIENTTNAIVKYYQDTITAFTQNYNANTTRLMELLNEELAKKVADLSAAAAVQVDETKKVVTDEIRKEIREVQDRIDAYTIDKYKEVDEKVYQIISETAKNTVGKVINMVDHQELVMSALETAKKDRFFS